MGPSGDPLVAITCCGVLADVMSVPDSAGAQIVMQAFSNQKYQAHLQQLLDINKPKKDIKKIDGTNFGCPYGGYYDHSFSLLQKLMAKGLADIKAGKNDAKTSPFITTLNNVNMTDTVMNFSLNISSKTEISPKGFVSMLTFIFDVINMSEHKVFMQKVFKNCLKLFCSFLRENQLLAV